MNLLKSLLKSNLDFECPECHFINEFTLNDAFLEVMFVCRGCKKNIHLNDNLWSVKKAKRDISEAEQSLASLFKKPIVIKI